MRAIYFLKLKHKVEMTLRAYKVKDNQSWFIFITWLTFLKSWIKSFMRIKNLSEFAPLSLKKNTKKLTDN